MLKAVLKKDSLFCWAFDFPWATVINYSSILAVWLRATLPGIQIIAVPRNEV
jgi:hypothetical protein